MAKKNLWMGILAAALVFGMAVTGCDDSNGNDERDNRLVLDAGWAWVEGSNKYGIIFESDGSYQQITRDSVEIDWESPYSGTWTTRNGEISMNPLYPSFSPYSIEGDNLTLHILGDRYFTKTNVGTID